MNNQLIQHKKKLIKEIRQNLTISDFVSNINGNNKNLNLLNDDTRTHKKHVIKNPSIFSIKDHISISSKSDTTKIGINDFDLKFRLYPIKKRKNLWVIFAEIAETYKNMIITKSLEHRASFIKKIRMKSANIYNRNNSKKHITDKEKNKSNTYRSIYTLSNGNLKQNMPLIYKVNTPVKVQRLKNKHYSNFPIYSEVDSQGYPINNNQNLRTSTFLCSDHHSPNKMMRDQITNTPNIFIKYLRKDLKMKKFNTHSISESNESNKVNLFIDMRNSPEKSKKINLKQYIINKDKNIFRSGVKKSNKKNKNKVKNMRANCYFNKLHLKKIDKTIDKYSFNNKD